jgi:plastocyanin
MDRRLAYCFCLLSAACGDKPSIGSPAPAASGADANALTLPTAANCTAANAPPGTAASLTNYQFSPACLRLAAGTSLTFTNKDVTALHTVTTEANQVDSFDSGDFTGSATYAHQFNTPGTIRLICKNHSNMHMTVVVE